VELLSRGELGANPNPLRHRNRRGHHRQDHQRESHRPSHRHRDMIADFDGEEVGTAETRIQSRRR
jgi:hypothetical protein